MKLKGRDYYIVVLSLPVQPESFTNREDKMEGWISIHRKMKNNFLYPKSRKFTEFEAWIDLLIEVNYKDKQVPIGNQIILCKRGQSVNSLNTWATKWNWNKSKVRRFFIVLSEMNQISIGNVQKTTRITICNYDKYQGKRNENETKMKRKPTPNNNNNNENNIYAHDFNIFWNKYHLITGLAKTDKAPAKKIWDKLNNDEKKRQLQISNHIMIQ